MLIYSFKVARGLKRYSSSLAVRSDNHLFWPFSSRCTEFFFVARSGKRRFSTLAVLLGVHQDFSRSL